MNTMDIVLIAIILISGVLGARRGLVKVVAFLLVLVLATLIMLRFTVWVEPMLRDAVQHPQLRWALAMFVLFALVVFIGHFIANLLTKTVRAVGLGGSDSLLGGIFGCVGGILLLALLRVSFGDYLYITFPGLYLLAQESALMPLINTVAFWLEDNLGAIKEQAARILLEQLPGDGG